MRSAPSTNSALPSLIVDDMENKWTDVYILFMALEEGWELFALFPLFLSLSFFLSPFISVRLSAVPRRDILAKRTHFIAKLRPSDPVKCFRFLLGGNRKSRAVNQ